MKIYELNIKHVADKETHTCPDCENLINGEWRCGVCDECNGTGIIPNGETCSNCLGIGSPLCCRCEGTGIDLY